MEKICIVKLRKNLPGMSLSGNALLRSEADTRGAGSPAVKEPVRRVVSLPLTEAQLQTLQANPNTASLLGSESFATGEAKALGGNMVTIRLELPALPPLRLLKLPEVMRMLRVSKSYLYKIINKGYLQTYRLGRSGRLRRILFEDVLAYLEENRELTDSGPMPRQEKRSASLGEASAD